MDKMQLYRRNWVQHINIMPLNRLPKIIKTADQNAEGTREDKETSWSVRPERVSKWPTSMLAYDDYDDKIFSWAAIKILSIFLG